MKMLGRDIISLAHRLDGHTIFKVSLKDDYPGSDEIIDRLRTRIESDLSNPKEITSTDDPNIVIASCVGVYGLSLLWGLGQALEAHGCNLQEAKGKSGRGWQARALQSAIQACVCHEFEYEIS